MIKAMRWMVHRARIRGAGWSRRPLWRITLGILLLAAPLWSPPALADAPGRPHALLFGATLDDARRFAVQAAHGRGWTIRAVTMTTAEFEQILEADEIGDATRVQRLLRVLAEFTEEAGGIRVSLRADEVEWPGTDQEWSTDVTGRYAENLLNALASLRAKWETRPEDPGNPRRPLSTSDQPLAAEPLIAEEMGTWVYYAERHAQSRGCELTDQGAVLEASGQEQERYRILCQDGSVLVVLCHQGDCASDR